MQITIRKYQGVLRKEYRQANLNAKISNRTLMSNKNAIVYLSIFIILFVTACKQTEMKNDEAIYTETEAFRQAWNKGDVKLVTSFFTDDAIRVDGVGSYGAIQRGKGELEAAYTRLFHQTMSGIQMKYLDKGEIRMLSPDFAVWQGNLEIIRPDGISTKGHVVEILKKVNNRWLIVEAHPKFPSPPASAN